MRINKMKNIKFLLPISALLFFMASTAFSADNIKGYNNSLPNKKNINVAECQKLQNNIKIKEDENARIRVQLAGIMETIGQMPKNSRSAKRYEYEKQVQQLQSRLDTLSDEIQMLHQQFELRCQ